MESRFDHIYLVCLSDHYYRNRIFDIESPQNRDHAYDPFYLLRERFAVDGIRLDTYDYLGEQESGNYALLFADIPKGVEAIAKRHPDAEKFLLLMESPLIHPLSWDMEQHGLFRRIFTWDDTLADGDRYVKLAVPSVLPERLDVSLADKSRFCVMIAGNKRGTHPRELYSERVKTIRWFEANQPQEFDLYGFGWDERLFVGPRPVRALNRVRFVRRLFAENFPSYRGAVADKHSVLKQYRFAICYENIRDLPGYITEKLFDCFFAGCVPVYWGAGNVTDHIPPECFIDRREFATHEELYTFMKGMDDTRYAGYLDSIREFLRSPRAYPFSATCFAETIVNGMLHG
jgi:alpha(1,3/1,4) fucosyltransferase